jgi:hypothetical protein
VEQSYANRRGEEARSTIDLRTPTKVARYGPEAVSLPNPSSRSAHGILGAQPKDLAPTNRARPLSFGGWRSARRRAPIVGAHQEGTPGMTAATTPLQSKFGPIVADAAGTITVQEASDVLDYSRFRVCELLTASAGRVLVTDVLALKSFVAPSALDAAPAAKPAR